MRARLSLHLAVYTGLPIRIPARNVAALGGMVLRCCRAMVAAATDEPESHQSCRPAGIVLLIRNAQGKNG